MSRASSNPVLGPEGKPVSVIKLAVDITASEQAAQRAEAEHHAIEAAQTQLVEALGGALAKRSAEATKEIKALVANSTTDVAKGVKLVDEAGSTLFAISSKVAEMDALIKEIAASSAEQAIGLSEVNVAINQMDQVTQQNAAMVEETTAAANNLKTEANQLSILVERFDTGGGRAPALSRAATSRAAPGTIPFDQERVRRGASGRGGGAAAAAVQDWEQF